MGGGDLNLKKSWHPKKLANQEKVWKAEQEKNLEMKKLNDLRKEIEDERNREEYRDMAKKSGLIKDDGNKKLEWMYKGASDLLNREDYLLGKSIDKNFEELSSQEQQQKQSSSSSSNQNQPKNHVEHEIVPFSIRKYKEINNTDQVDLQRKLVEDPLMAIKQKEIDMRRKILENPVKLKELHRLLKQEKEEKATSSNLDSQKSKKSKKSKKKKRSNSSSSSSEDSDDLDKNLAEKYKKLKEKGDDSDEDTNLDKILAQKFQTLSKELDRMAKKKKRKDRSVSDEERDGGKMRKSPERRYDGSNRNRNDDTYPRNYDRRNRSRSGDRERRPINRRSRSKSPRNYRKRSPSVEKRYRRKSKSIERNYRKRSPSFERRFRKKSKSIERTYRRRSRSAEKKYKRKSVDRKSRSRSISIEKLRKQLLESVEKKKGKTSLKKSRSESREKAKKFKKRDSSSSDSDNDRSSRKVLPEKPKNIAASSSSDSESSDTPQKYADDEDERPVKKMNFGLVSASGQKLDLQRKDKVKIYTKEELRAAKESAKPVWKKPETKKLTEDEIEKRRLEMMENADWREKDRQKAVKRYRDEDDKEKSSKEFDKDFINRQLKSAQNQTTSIESRIKSNLNKIQRSKHNMDSNFAKR